MMLTLSYLLPRSFGLLLSSELWRLLLTSAGPIQYCAEVPPVCKFDPAGLGAGTITASQGVWQYENWT